MPARLAASACALDRLLHLPPPGLAAPTRSTTPPWPPWPSSPSTIRAWTRPRSPGVCAARWPGRFQRLNAGPPGGSPRAGGDLWLDGGHNPHGAAALARACAECPARDGRPWTSSSVCWRARMPPGSSTRWRRSRPGPDDGFDSPNAMAPETLAEAALQAGVQAKRFRERGGRPRRGPRRHAPAARDDLRLASLHRRRARQERGDLADAELLLDRHLHHRTGWNGDPGRRPLSGEAHLEPLPPLGV